MELIQGVLIFVAVVLFFEGIFLIVRARWSPEARRIKLQLRRLSREKRDPKDIDLVYRRSMSDIPQLNRFLSNIRLPLVQQLDRAIIQANLSYPLGVYLMTSGLLFVIGFAASFFITSWLTVRLAVGLAFGLIPILNIYRKKQKRLRRFEEQLPEALEMLARSIRAGHAFTGGLQLVGQEFDDPVGTEFTKTLDEINFGVGYEAALNNLLSRIESDDLKLFVISVVIQRTSGGNLAEILDNISRLIRERFVLRGQVKTLTAEARLSAYILVALPFLVGLFIFFANPSYVRLLFEDPIGNMMLTVAGVMMVVGIIVMKKMTMLKV
ncbi:MAG: type II secretion system F family protein [Syntrophales bacterium]|jgi:tight adherence protein B